MRHASLTVGRLNSKTIAGLVQTHDRSLSRLNPTRTGRVIAANLARGGRTRDRKSDKRNSARR
jgi:hypothetical protein